MGIPLRWKIFGILLAINLVNNLDRQVLGLVAPALQQEFAWGELGFARVVAAFQVSFAVMNLVSGRLVDYIGVRIGLAAAIGWFSVAQIAHVFARGVWSFGLARVGLAFGEAPVYPATLKGLAEWAPPRERSVAAGMVHFGVMAGAVMAPILIPWMTSNWGWRSGFVLTGILGFLLIPPWLALYHHPERHAGLTGAERMLILAGRASANTVSESFSWLGLFRRRQLWAYVALQAIVNPAWWFIVYWLPKFLGEAYGIKGVAITPYVTTVYAVAAVGAVVGGSSSGWLLRRGLSPNAARKCSLLGCGVLMPVVVTAGWTASPWLAIAVIGVAAFVHQTWTATGAAILADLFPSRMVASVAGITSFIGSLAGVVGAEATGRILQAQPGNYLPMFLYAGAAYMVATLVIHLLSPRLEPVRDELP